MKRESVRAFKQRSHFLLQLLGFIRDSVRAAFIASLFSYLLLLLLDQVDKGFASFFFDMNILMWVVVLTGVATVLAAGLARASDEVRCKAYPAWALLPAAGGLGVLGAILVFHAIPLYGWQRLLASSVGGLSMALLAGQLLRDSVEGDA